MRAANKQTLAGWFRFRRLGNNIGMALPTQLSIFSRSNVYFCIAAVVIFIIAFNLASIQYGSTSIRTGDPSTNALVTCRSDIDVAVFDLKTKLGVSYDGGHWFHMAENFLTEHSRLRKQLRLTNATTVIYNFDQDGFVEKLNGITRLFVVLGTVLTGQNLKSVYFAHIPNWRPDAADSASDSQRSPGKAIKISRPNFKSLQMISLLTSEQHRDRFVHTSTSGLLPDPFLCARYMGSIGGNWPTPQRGHWFANPGDVTSLRSKISHLCQTTSKLGNDTNSQADRKRRLVIYQRDLSRKIANEEEMLAHLRRILPADKWTIEIMIHQTGRSPCTIQQSLATTDVLLTSHGFQSMLLLFLPPNAILFEVFPYKYYKRAYGPLGGEYGVIHGGVMSPPVTWLSTVLLRIIPTSMCMKSKQCRNYARNHDVILTAGGVEKLNEMIRARFGM